MHVFPCHLEPSSFFSSFLSIVLEMFQVMAYDGRHIAVSLAPLTGPLTITLEDLPRQQPAQQPAAVRGTAVKGAAEVKSDKPPKIFTLVLKNADAAEIDLGATGVSWSICEWC